MAQVKVEQLETGCPVIQRYLVEDDARAALLVLCFDGYSEEWANFHNSMNEQ